MNAAMLIEREQHLGVAPHQRSSERDGYANGFKPRNFHTTFGNLDLAVPQVRESSEIFRTSLLEKGSRSDRALKSAIATMYVQGVSTRRVTKVVEELCGFEVSSGQVSNLNKQLDGEFKKWRNRPLEEMRYLTIDATYYKVRIDGIVRDCATLIAIGVDRSDNKRTVLGVSCALSEAEVHWRDFFNSLKENAASAFPTSSSRTPTPACAPPSKPPSAPAPGNDANSTYSKTHAAFLTVGVLPGNDANSTYSKTRKTTSPNRTSKAPSPARSKPSSTPTPGRMPKKASEPLSRDGKRSSQNSPPGPKRTSPKASPSFRCH